MTMTDQTEYMTQELAKLRDDRKILVEALKKYAMDFHNQLQVLKDGGVVTKISYDMGGAAYEALYKVGEKLGP